MVIFHSFFIVYQRVLTIFLLNVWGIRTISSVRIVRPILCSDDSGYPTMEVSGNAGRWVSGSKMKIQHHSTKQNTWKHLHLVLIHHWCWFIIQPSTNADWNLLKRLSPQDSGSTHNWSLIIKNDKDIATLFGTKHHRVTHLSLSQDMVPWNPLMFDHNFH